MISSLSNKCSIIWFVIGKSRPKDKIVFIDESGIKDNACCNYGLRLYRQKFF
ncbi:hypothetical protein OTSGILL_1331 [Orientia tsutsugamushi str. Gilliam]|uniref:IS630 family transposase n=1 Tax=Orientia tsutsugamushi str. Gilliam TaxID=1359184 RepID=A0A0F3MDL8_ORITS|nr:hypothetical protein OTSGILL_1331 [Orientia tsutsugamushi str. Gilliam]